MTADRLAWAVRGQLGLGRVLPLGGPEDTVWVTESAAAAVLRSAAAEVPGVRLGALRIGSAGGPDDEVPGHGPLPDSAPSGALPRGPLRVEAAFEATPEHPLPDSAGRLRAALWAAATVDVGLEPEVIDLTVTGLLASGASAPPPEVADVPAGAPSATPAARAAAAVPGVAALTSRLGGRRHPSQVQIAVGGGHRALDVGRAVATAVTAVTRDVTTVVVTDITGG
ncbi:hypothetical protein [Streptomyces sp. NPDC026673]|uniref:hypothetical protein n=1 Tax=Streptomyces sp. NPDC026673 TaxID=3155724 RepID=UPI0033D0019A